MDDIKGIRQEMFREKIQQVKEVLGNIEDSEQVGIVHEILDDTPFKTRNYLKYIHEEYYIVHNKENIIRDSIKTYKLTPTNLSKKRKDLFDIVKERDSVRDYVSDKIEFSDFSNIIYYTFGVKNIKRGAYDKREYPFRYINSQGGINYLDLYIIVNNVEGIQSGLYYYSFIDNEICMMDYGNLRGIIGEINYQNEFTQYSNFVTIMVADLSRVMPKYYKRAYRMAHVDTGIAVSYMQLIAEAQGLSSCVVAGYLEHKLEDLLELTESDYPIVTMCFGKKSV